MVEYCKGKTGEERDILDFGNLVFSQAARPHDFKELIPKMYEKKADMAQCHYLAKKDGRINGMTAMLPMNWNVCGHQLSIGLVGTVSVHKYARGEGFMKGCMKMMQDDAKERGIDFLALGGLRQRYNHFGYERGCVTLRFSVTQTNISHALQEVDVSEYSLKEITEHDTKMLDEAFELYEKQPVHGARPRGSFLDIMHTWNSRLIGLLKNDKMIGYLCAGNDTVSEILLDDVQDVRAVCKMWLITGNIKTCTFVISAYETEYIKEFDSFAEGCSSGDTELLNILNWENTLTAFLSLKQKTFGLETGHAVICIEEDGTFKINVENDTVSVQKTDAEPDMTLTHLQAERLFFSPAMHYYCHPSVLHDWFPLNISFKSADEF